MSARCGTCGAPIVRPSDEAHLIQRAQRHDPEAIGELYNRHVDPIYQYVRYRTNDAVVAEDITAEVFLRALESLSAYDDRGAPFAAWLYRIAQARVVDYWRRTQRRASVPWDDPQVGSWLVTDETAYTDVLQDQVLNEALQRLTEDQQQVLILKFMQGLNNREIAQVLDKTEGAVKALQRRGLEALARILRYGHGI
jgi:RNA polymerase sigma-70 factor (ECF subfamily)